MMMMIAGDANDTASYTTLSQRKSLNSLPSEKQSYIYCSQLQN